MNNAFYQTLLAIILIPYGVIFLVQLWNVFGPSIRARGRIDAE